MSQVTIYTKPYCPYCVRAVDLLERKGVAFTEIEAAFDVEEIALAAHDWHVSQPARGREGPACPGASGGVQRRHPAQEVPVRVHQRKHEPAEPLGPEVDLPQRRFGPVGGVEIADEPVEVVKMKFSDREPHGRRRLERVRDVAEQLRDVARRVAESIRKTVALA